MARRLLCVMVHKSTSFTAHKANMGSKTFTPVCRVPGKDRRVNPITLVKLFSRGIDKGSLIISPIACAAVFKRRMELSQFNDTVAP